MSSNYDDDGGGGDGKNRYYYYDYLILAIIHIHTIIAIRYRLLLYYGNIISSIRGWIYNHHTVHGTRHIHHSHIYWWMTHKNRRSQYEIT